MAFCLSKKSYSCENHPQDSGFQNDKSRKDRLILANTPLAYNLAKADFIKDHRVPLIDLMLGACIGLTEATDSYRSGI